MLRRILFYGVACSTAGVLIVAGVFLANWQQGLSPTIQTKPLPAPAAVVPPRQWSWAEVEQELDRLRAERKSRPAATGQLTRWYFDLSQPKFTHSKDFSEHLSILEKWRRERPESPVPLIVLAKAHIDWAWEERGTGWASSVSEQSWPIFHGRIGQARQYIEKAIKLGVQDGHAYVVLLEVARADGHSLEQTRKWLEEGHKVDPTYFWIDVAMADYLMPRWHGNPGDVERYAAEVVKRLPGDDGLEAYARIAWMVNEYDCYGSNTLYFGKFDPQLLSQAAQVWAKRYPKDQPKMHFAALCTLAAQDHAAARVIRPHVEQYYESPALWPWKFSHDEFLAWCSAEEVPADEEMRVWTSYFPHGGLAFADDPNYIWCGHEHRGPASLIDLKGKRIRISLNSARCESNNLAVDLKKQWVIASAWQPFQGLLFWDLSQPSLGQTIDVPGLCQALAIHPEKNLVAWGGSKSLRLLEVPSGKVLVEAEVPQTITTVCFSPTGKMLAVGPEPCRIYDTQSGQIRCELPHSDTSPISPAVCLQALAVDDDGTSWAVVEKRAPQPKADAETHLKQYAIVRFAADGSSAETLLEEIPSGRCWLSADRRLLAVAKRTKYGPNAEGIEVWDVQSRVRTHELAGHWCAVEDIAFSGDNSRLASTGNRTGILKVWQLDTSTARSE